MNKNCYCGRTAAWAVIDKFGFMEPGVLCPSHYIKWTNSSIEKDFIFHRLKAGASLMKEFYKDRDRARTGWAPVEVTDRPEERDKPTMESIKLEAILTALEANNGHIQATCRELHISKATFYRYLKRHKIVFERTLKWTKRGETKTTTKSQTEE